MDVSTFRTKTRNAGFIETKEKFKYESNHEKNDCFIDNKKKSFKSKNQTIYVREKFEENHEDEENSLDGIIELDIGNSSSRNKANNSFKFDHHPVKFLDFSSKNTYYLDNQNTDNHINILTDSNFQHRKKRNKEEKDVLQSKIEKNLNENPFVIVDTKAKTDRDFNVNNLNDLVKEIEIFPDSKFDEVSIKIQENKDYFKNSDFYQLFRENLYEFIQKPAPKGLMVRCKILVNKGVFNEYSFFLEENTETENEDMLIMKTSRKKSIASVYYSFKVRNNKNLNKKPHENKEIKFGYLNSNMSRGTFILIGNLNQNNNELENVDSSINNYDFNNRRAKTALSINSQSGEQHYFNLDYNTKLGSSKPKDFSVDISLKNETMCEKTLIDNSINSMFQRISKRQTLNTKKPTFDPENKVYKLDFKGRAKLPSSFNLQLINESNPNEVVFQIGKIKSKHYNCDFSYPLCAFQAFGIAVSCLSRI